MPAGVQGSIFPFPTARVERVEGVCVLVGIDRVYKYFRIVSGRNRKLNEKRVHRRIVVERGNLRKRSFGSAVGGKDNILRFKSDVRAGAHLVSDVYGRSGVVADPYHRKSGAASVTFKKSF